MEVAAKRAEVMRRNQRPGTALGTQNAREWQDHVPFVVRPEIEIRRDLARQLETIVRNFELSLEAS